MRIVAEIAQAHEGSVGIALSMIEAAKKAGATDVKFQMHIAEEESTKEESFRVKIFPEDKTRYEYWERTSFSIEMWRKVIDHCKRCEIGLIVSPFSDRALSDCVRLGIGKIKIGSGEIFNSVLLRKAAELADELIVSTGMSNWKEIDEAYSICRQSKSLWFLQCTSKYPSALNQVGLENIDMLYDRYRCKVGLSDHSGKITPALLAFSRTRCEMLEVHVTFSRDMFGPDARASLEFTELETLVGYLKEFKQIEEGIVDKDKESSEREEMKILFRRSIVSARRVLKGSVISSKDICFKKPGTGIPMDRVKEIYGREAVVDIEEGTILKREMLK